MIVNNVNRFLIDIIACGFVKLLQAPKPGSRALIGHAVAGLGCSSANLADAQLFVRARVRACNHARAYALVRAAVRPRSGKNFAAAATASASAVK